MTHIERATVELHYVRHLLEYAKEDGATKKEIDTLQRKAEYLEAVVEALSRADDADHLRRATEMVPLTLEQLRGMDGEPAWIVEYPDWGHWELSEDASDYIADRDTELYGLTYPDPEGRDGLHKLGWLAYHYPPVATDTNVGGKDINVPTSINLDAWEPCDECRNKCCFNCLYDNLSMQSEPCNSCDGDKWETKHLFCPNCGRPLTPEACAMQEKRLRGRK